jgi:hypothetical protein
MTKTISRRGFNELLGSSAVAIGFGGRKALPQKMGMSAGPRTIRTSVVNFRNSCHFVSNRCHSES